MGSRYTPTCIHLFVYTYMTRSIDLKCNELQAGKTSIPKYCLFHLINIFLNLLLQQTLAVCTLYHVISWAKFVTIILEESDYHLTTSRSIPLNSGQSYRRLSSPFFRATTTTCSSRRPAAPATAATPASWGSRASVPGWGSTAQIRTCLLTLIFSCKLAPGFDVFPHLLLLATPQSWPVPFPFPFPFP